MYPSLTILLMFALSIGSSIAAGVPDNSPETVRPVPPPGKPVAPQDREAIESGLKQLEDKIGALRELAQSKPLVARLLPDVQIFHKAVHDALAYDEIFNPTNEIVAAKALIAAGLARAEQLRDSNPSWLNSTGLVVRGYISKIDGSIQPYGLVVPSTYQASGAQKHRLDAWFHGRGETLSELNFLNERLKSPGEFTPVDTLVLHLYGRYCNANKFAGEIDLFEALDHVKTHYRVDDNRLVIRGFSMGGAACWQFAAHYAGKWAAAAPGAGFSETPDFLKVFQKETLAPTWYEKKLWHMYDCTDYALNFFNCPTVAYSGEVDSQKQAADMMAAAMKTHGIDLIHIIGPATAHRYHPDSKIEINRRIDAIAMRGRDPVPRKVRFQTYTLRYNEMLWVRLDALDAHWEEARVDAEIVNDHHIVAKTKNARALSFIMQPGSCPLDMTQPQTIELDGQTLNAPKPGSDRSWNVHFRKLDNRWVSVASLASSGLEKAPGLQGPIDDAFMDSFIMVTPSGSPLHNQSGSWALAEQQRAFKHWRSQFRGEARQVADTAVTPELIAKHNLVLWGDPSSNKVLRDIADKLPISWTADSIVVGPNKYDTSNHALIMIYPNPLNPKRYVVLNSGFTFRDYDYLNNARQVSKLPDYAVIDLSIPPNSRYPGKVVDAGFFGERWELKQPNSIAP